jgi:hydrogenase maturation protease
MAANEPRSDRQPARPPVLILGVGNILLRDEGVGVRVVQEMEGLDPPPDVELFDGATAGFDLLDALADRRKVVVIDAIDADGEPGDMVRLAGEELGPLHESTVSLHDVGVVETLALARQLGCAPEEVVVIGVVPANVGYGLSLSDKIAAAIPGIIDQALAEAIVPPAGAGQCPASQPSPFARVEST